MAGSDVSVPAIVFERDLEVVPERGDERGWR